MYLSPPVVHEITKDFKPTNIQSQDRINLSATVTYYIKFATSFRIHRSLEHKVITNQVHNKVVESSSFETTHAHLVQI
jgi:hypothetical protein